MSKQLRYPKYNVPRPKVTMTADSSAVLLLIPMLNLSVETKTSMLLELCKKKTQCYCEYSRLSSNRCSHVQKQKKSDQIIKYRFGAITHYRTLLIAQLHSCGPYETEWQKHQRKSINAYRTTCTATIEFGTCYRTIIRLFLSSTGFNLLVNYVDTSDQI